MVRQSPRVGITDDAKRRMRSFELEQLAKSCQTRCDICDREVLRSESIEMYKGNVNMLVACIACLNISSLEMEFSPVGLHYLYRDGESDEVTVKESDRIPFSKRPE